MNVLETTLLVILLMFTVLPDQVAASGTDGEPVLGTPLAIRFELDAEGRAAAFTFTQGTYAPPDRFLRVGDLPDGWE